VLPILHLNGYKIAGPTVLRAFRAKNWTALLSRLRLHAVLSSKVTIRTKMHQLMAATLDTVVAEIGASKRAARRGEGFKQRPCSWPMIVLRSPKGWTGPKVVDGKKTEGTWRSHQVPMGDMSHPGHVKMLEQVAEELSAPQELFDADGKLRPELAGTRPER
jgi:xylulose-5-phosphate/fructose-6-phosphate phosphoketolase